jgi:hypothetical protein
MGVLNQVRKGAEKELEYKRSLNSSELALMDYKDLVKKTFHWRNVSISKLEAILQSNN